LNWRVSKFAMADQFTGHLTQEGFKQCCNEIMVKSKQFNDSFQLLQNKQNQLCEEQSYLMKKVSKMVDIVVDDSAFITESDLLQDEDLLDEYDCISSAAITTSMLITYEYHFVYSESYNVPVCYFQAYKQDGMSLNLDEIWKLVPSTHSHALKEKWSFISQQEHPYLLTPFFHLHPCHTAVMMKALCNCKSVKHISNNNEDIKND